MRLIDANEAIIRQWMGNTKPIIYRQYAVNVLKNAPTVNAVITTSDYREGDVCIYEYDNDNESCSLVEIVKILNDERGVAEVKFLKVFVDDSGNGFFNYLLRSGGTMNASFKYLKNITPRGGKNE